MDNRGQILTHSIVTTGGIIIAALTAYYTAQMGIQGQIATLSASLSSISATQTAQTNNISDLQNRVENLQQDFSQLNNHFGLQTISQTNGQN